MDIRVTTIHFHYIIEIIMKKIMKYHLLIFSLLVSLNIKSQQEENVGKYYFPNTNIGKSSLALYGGAGYMPYTGKLANYYKPHIGGAMSLDYYHRNNLTFSLSIMGTDGNLRKGVIINNNQWAPKDTTNFWSYGLTVGYAVLNKVRWRINPFGGIVLSQSELISPDGDKYKIGVKPSPVIGVNFSHRFINIKKEMQWQDERGGASFCFGINARIAYVPFVVNKKEVPFSGGIWYTTIGITFNLF